MTTGPCVECGNPHTPHSYWGDRLCEYHNDVVRGTAYEPVADYADMQAEREYQEQRAFERAHGPEI